MAIIASTIALPIYLGQPQYISTSLQAGLCLGVIISISISSNLWQRHTQTNKWEKNKKRFHAVGVTPFGSAPTGSGQWGLRCWDLGTFGSCENGVCGAWVSDTGVRDTLINLL